MEHMNTNTSRAQVMAAIDQSISELMGMIQTRRQPNKQRRADNHRTIGNEGDSSVRRTARSSYQVDTKNERRYSLEQHGPEGNHKYACVHIEQRKRQYGDRALHSIITPPRRHSFNHHTIHTTPNQPTNQPTNQHSVA